MTITLSNNWHMKNLTSFKELSILAVSNSSSRTLLKPHANQVFSLTTLLKLLLEHYQRPSYGHLLVFVLLVILAGGDIVGNFLLETLSLRGFQHYILTSLPPAFKSFSSSVSFIVLNLSKSLRAQSPFLWTRSHSLLALNITLLLVTPKFLLPFGHFP